MRIGPAHPEHLRRRQRQDLANASRLRDARTAEGPEVRIDLGAPQAEQILNRFGSAVPSQCRAKGAWNFTHEPEPHHRLVADLVQYGCQIVFFPKPRIRYL